MPVELVCTACTAKLRVPGFTPGRAVRCPKCATVFVPVVQPEPQPQPPAAVAPPPAPPAAPPAPANPPAPAANPFDFDKKPEPAGATTAAKNAKIVGAPNAKHPPRAQPVAPKSKPNPRDDDADAPAPKAKAPANSKPAKREREKEARPINPAVLIGGLAFLALGAALIAGVLIFGGDKDEGAKRPPVAKDKEEPRPKPPDPKPPEPEPQPPEPEPKPKPKPVEKFKPPLFPQLNPPAPEEPEAEPVFAPVAPLATRPVPLTKRKELALRGTVTDACVGGGGRFWCLLLGEESEVAVVDFANARVARTITLEKGRALVAAGMHQLVVAYPETKKLVRYDLLTGKKEHTARVASATESLLMGSATAGPLLVNGRAFALDTLAPLRGVAVRGGEWAAQPQHRISPCGSVLTGWTPNKFGVHVATLGDLPVGHRSVGWRYEKKELGPAVPTVDRAIVTAGGVYADTGYLRSASAFKSRVPAQEGGYYLDAPELRDNPPYHDLLTPTRAYQMDRNEQICLLPGVGLPGVFAGKRDGSLHWDERAVWSIQGGYVAVLSSDAESVVVHPFDFEKELRQWRVPHMLVLSRPPVAVPGREFHYTPVVRFNAPEVTVKVAIGPRGMRVLDDGSVGWSVPPDWSEPVRVVLEFTDDAGRTLRHPFDLVPGAPDGTASFDPVP